MKHFTPINEKILVRELKPTETTLASGIVVINSDSNKTCKRAIVIELGRGVRNPVTGTMGPFQVTPKQEVILGPYAGLEIELGEEKFLIITEDDIQGTIK